MGKIKSMIEYTVIFFGVVLGIIAPQSAQAREITNPTVIELKANKTYLTYDITGDKKNDIILIQRLNDLNGDCQSVKIYINNVIIYRLNNLFSLGVIAKLYTLKNGIPFLYIYCPESHGNGDGACMLLQYKSGKMKKIINFETLFGKRGPHKYGAHKYGAVLNVKKNTLKAVFHMMSYALGAVSCEYDYVYKNGTLVRKSNVGKISKNSGQLKKKFIVAKSLKAYTSVKARKLAFTLKKGVGVNVKKIYMGQKGMWISVKYKNKYGWVKIPPNYSYDLFSNVHLAG